MKFEGDLIGCVLLNTWGEKGISIIWCEGCAIKIKDGECWVDGVINDDDDPGKDKFAIIKVQEK